MMQKQTCKEEDGFCMKTKAATYVAAFVFV